MFNFNHSILRSLLFFAVKILTFLRRLKVKPASNFYFYRRHCCLRTSFTDKTCIIYGRAQLGIMSFKKIKWDSFSVSSLRSPVFFYLVLVSLEIFANPIFQFWALWFRLEERFRLFISICGLVPGTWLVLMLPFLRILVTADRNKVITHFNRINTPSVCIIERSDGQINYQRSYASKRILLITAVVWVKIVMHRKQNTMHKTWRAQ